MITIRAPRDQRVRAVAGASAVLTAVGIALGAAVAADTLSAPDVAAAEESPLDRAIDLNIAGLEWFLDLGGSCELSPEGTVLLDAEGTRALSEMQYLAVRLLADVEADPALVERAIDAARADGDSGDARGEDYRVTYATDGDQARLGIVPVDA